MTERLSRLIDGELDPAEAEELKAVLASDRSLRREFEGLNRVRSSLRSLADRERPPAELEALVDPLLRGKPETAFGRPWVRWMATAAAVVLGVTVVLEVQRREPDPAILNWQERALEGAAAEPTQRFSLAPLPTSSAPAEGLPRGAADRLVSAPEPEVDLVNDPAPALEVMGPLESGSIGGEALDDGRDLDGPSARSRAKLEADHSLAPEQQRSESAEPSLRSASGAVRTDAGREKSLSGERENRAGTDDSEVSGSGAQLFVFMASETAWRAFEPDGPCEAGRYALRIRVEDGVIREVWPVANPPAPTRQVRASQLVLGLEVKNVGDGEYAAEVVVEPRRSSNR